MLPQPFEAPKKTGLQAHQAGCQPGPAPMISAATAPLPPQMGLMEPMPMQIPSSQFEAAEVQQVKSSFLRWPKLATKSKSHQL